jgi:hypothetical protein
MLPNIPPSITLSRCVMILLLVWNSYQTEYLDLDQNFRCTIILGLHLREIIYIEFLILH